MLLGTFMDTGTEVKVNSRLIATENGQAMMASQVVFPKNKIITRLLPRHGGQRPR
jgi:hypothetical protein